jgi:hypothetical protein
MPTSKEYRQHAEDCLKLANTATDHFAKVGLEDLAHEFQQAANKLDNSRSADQ